MGPDYMTPDEIKALDKIIDCDISDFIEFKHIREVPVVCESVWGDDE